MAAIAESPAATGVGDTGLEPVTSARLHDDRRFTADKLADLLIAHRVNPSDGFEDPRVGHLNKREASVGPGTHADDGTSPPCRICALAGAGQRLP
jgi:hypothetical protein